MLIKPSVIFKPIIKRESYKTRVQLTFALKPGILPKKLQRYPVSRISKQMRSRLAGGVRAAKAATRTISSPKFCSTKVAPPERVEINPAVTAARVVKIQRKNGVIVQDCDTYIGRRITKGGWNLPQSKWHNPFKRANDSQVARREAIAKYEAYLLRSPELLAALPELRGKVLGCWCKTHEGAPCHGDVLVRLLGDTANGLPPGGENLL